MNTVRIVTCWFDLCGHENSAKRTYVIPTADLANEYFPRKPARYLTFPKGPRQPGQPHDILAGPVHILRQ